MGERPADQGRHETRQKTGQLRWRAAAAGLLALLLLLFPAVAQGAGVAHTPNELEFLRLINEYRQSKGVGALLLSDPLSVAAQKHNKDMGKYNFFEHTTRASDYFAVGSHVGDRAPASGYKGATLLGENLAAGFALLKPAAVLAGWKASPGHDANMLNPGFKVIGISCVGVAGSEYGFYWTTDFGDYVDPSADDPNAAGDSGPFPDVAASDPYVIAIEGLSEEGVITGYPDGTFGPDRPVWRQHFAKMIVLALGLSASEGDVAPFADVESGGPTTLYPDNFIAVAAAQGITQGTGPNSFSPTRDISRAQVVTMVVRALERLRPGTLRASDPALHSTWAEKLASPHAETARLAQANGLLAGLPVETLDPWGPMSRAEVAQVLFNLQGLLGG